MVAGTTPTSIGVGEVVVTALNDGTVHLPPTYYPGVDWEAHADLIDPDGTYHIPAGCFLIEGEGFTILVDAGIGPNAIPFPPEIAAAADLAEPPRWIARGGDLPAQLAAVGVAAEDVTTVFLTHLDADHVGWVARDGELCFPCAQVVCSAIELAREPGPAPGEAEGRAGLAIAEEAGLLRQITGPEVELAPGVTALFAPGHTPGHYVVRVVSCGHEAQLLADAVHHPLQLNDPGISFLLETTPEASLATRERLLSQLEGRDVLVNMVHFPGLGFHRVVVEDGRRRWESASGADTIDRATRANGEAPS
ncbi:MAG TPA: MBL fold metallo-hydrolase [Solirubrobacterales bacterium]